MFEWAVPTGLFRRFLKKTTREVPSESVIDSMADKLQTPVQCSTCNRERAKDRDELSRWTCECPRCAQHSGRARKQVRHCSRCQLPLVVISVPASVNLLCKVCYDGDQELVSAGKLSREARRNYDRLTQANRKLADLENQLIDKREETNAEVKRVTSVLSRQAIKKQDEITSLTAQLDRSEEKDLTARLRNKMLAQYGVDDREAMMLFSSWVVGTHWFIESGPKPDPETLLDEYQASLEGVGG